MERQHLTRTTQSNHQRLALVTSAQSTRPPEHPLRQLQRTIGNRAVGRLIQAQLRVSQPGDAYEQEADRVADEVMRMPDPDATGSLVVSGQARTSAIQRVCPACENELHRQPMEQEETERLQTQLVSEQTPEVAPNTETRINAMRGSGQPLPDSVRAFFEPRFGHDFSPVRVHTDSRGAELAQAVNARAFTVGQDVVFGAGQYAPGTAEGKKLLAHELTHTIQQTVGSMSYKLMKDAGAPPPAPIKKGKVNSTLSDQNTCIRSYG